MGSNMSIHLQLPKRRTLQPSITVFGVGGAGGNAVNNMIRAQLDGVNFVIANTDAQALEFSEVEHRIQLGESITQGLGAGSYPEVGKAAAEESVELIQSHLDGCNMVFITAGMGGGTGTGAAPVIARLAKDQGILTVAVVTKPFHFEGANRMRVAEFGLEELHKYVDTLIVIPNQNLFRVADKKTTFAEAFKMADDVLHAGVRGVTDLMVTPGLINLDFADVRTVMSEMGKAMMGTGEAEGDGRAIQAAEAAISNPLLDNASMKGARGVLINITGGSDMTLFEVDEAANRIREEVDQDANIIFGSAFNQNLEGKLRVSVVATGIENPEEKSSPKPQRVQAEPSRPQQDIFSKAAANFGAHREPKNLASLRPVSAEVTSSSPSQEFFVSAAAVEPETVAKNSGFGNGSGYLNTSVSGSAVSEVDRVSEFKAQYAAHVNKNGSVDNDKSPPSQKGFGFFSRMGAAKQSEGNGLQNTSTAKSESRYQVVEQPVTALDEKEYQQDLLDIPAYLRRSTTSQS